MCYMHILIKGTMSPLAHVHAEEKHFEIAGPTFSEIQSESS